MRCNDVNVVDIKGKQSLSPSPSPKREGSNYSLKWRELFWGYLGMVMLLIIKRKTIYSNSSRNMLHFTR